MLLGFAIAFIAIVLQYGSLGGCSPLGFIAAIFI
jgi:hypothetical protein